MARRYKIVYYDPFDLTIINEETVNTVDQRLRLENYPLLIGNRQFVFFKAWRDPIGGSEESFSPTIRDPRLSNMSEKQIHSNAIEPISLSEFESVHQVANVIYPNPTNGLVRFSGTTESLMDVTIIDATGLEVLKIDDFKSNNDLDLRCLANGIYLIKINDDSQSFKLVKND